MKCIGSPSHFVLVGGFNITTLAFNHAFGLAFILAYTHSLSYLHPISLSSLSPAAKRFAFDFGQHLVTLWLLRYPARKALAPDPAIPAIAAHFSVVWTFALPFHPWLFQQVVCVRIFFFSRASSKLW